MDGAEEAVDIDGTNFEELWGDVEKNDEGNVEKEVIKTFVVTNFAKLTT